MSEVTNTDTITMWPVGKVAAVLSVDPQTVRRKMALGEFGPVYKMGRITRVAAQGVLDYVSRNQKVNGDGEGE